MLGPFWSITSLSRKTKMPWFVVVDSPEPGLRRRPCPSVLTHRQRSHRPPWRSRRRVTLLVLAVHQNRQKTAAYTSLRRGWGLWGVCLSWRLLVGEDAGRRRLGGERTPVRTKGIWKLNIAWILIRMDYGHGLDTSRGWTYSGHKK